MAHTSVTDIKFTTKLVVSRRGERVICRQRLVDLLHDNIHLQAQVICAPAGYGKTTLLVDFANDLDIPICLYQLDHSDQDAKLLLEGILASIRFHFPNFGSAMQSQLDVAEDVVGEGVDRQR